MPHALHNANDTVTELLVYCVINQEALRSRAVLSHVLEDAAACQLMKRGTDANVVADDERVLTP